MALPEPDSQDMLTTAWPVITCPAQIRVAIPADTTIDRRVTYCDKGRINPSDENSRPFGYPAPTIPPVAGAIALVGGIVLLTLGTKKS